MKEIIATENEFYAKFNPIKNRIDKNASFDGCMFETFGAEEEHIRKTAIETPRKVWTILDADGDLYIDSGFHFVNRLGYLITEEEFEEGVSYSFKVDGMDD